MPDQERIIEGLNKQSADGTDTELVALAAAVLIAIIEVHGECVVGGALRARPVPGGLGEQVRHVHPAVVQLGAGGQVEVMVPICLILGTSISSGVLSLVFVDYQYLGVGVAVGLLRPLTSIPRPPHSWSPTSFEAMIR